MQLTKEEINKNAVTTFLAYNNIEPNNAMAYNKFETAYYVDESRIFREETSVIFNIIKESDIDIILPEINNIEFKTTFKTTEQNFHFNEEGETLTITTDESTKHNQKYKIILSSIYLDF